MEEKGTEIEEEGREKKKQKKTRTEEGKRNAGRTKGWSKAHI